MSAQNRLISLRCCWELKWHCLHIRDEWQIHYLLDKTAQKQAYEKHKHGKYLQNVHLLGALISNFYDVPQPVSKSTRINNNVMVEKSRHAFQTQIHQLLSNSLSAKQFPMSWLPFRLPKLVITCYAIPFASQAHSNGSLNSSTTGTFEWLDWQQ